MAVYTHINDNDLADYLKQYDIGEMHSLKGIAEGVENSNFLLTTDAGMFILTLYEKRVNPKDLPFFVGLMDHLAKNGLDCPLPIRMKTGEVLGNLAERPCAIISFLNGNSVSKPSADHCKQVGQVLAKLHLAADGFSLNRENGLGLNDWRPLFELSAPQADTVKPDLKNLISSELDFLEANWPSDLPHGVVHADLFTDNVFFLKDKLSGVIDFYFACNDLLAYDVATCLNAWCFESDGQFNATKGMALLKGYHAERAMSDEEVSALPVLCRGSALRFLLTRLYDWLNVPAGALVVPKDPAEYIDKLKFHQSISSAGEYGLIKS